ncbi:MAG: DUF5673 domain-containing protein [Mediterranea sp.]|nr:DUF5673 domain-containing protein [Mediterranea sp.]
MQKQLSISDKGIRYVLHWKINWDMIQSWEFDSNTLSLVLYLRNGEIKSIHKIPPKYSSDIKDCIEAHLKR